MKKILLTALLLAATVILVACGGGGQSDEIIMDEPVPKGADDAFLVELEFTAEEIVPNHITIPAGEKIYFVVYNSDTAEGDMNEDHNLVSPDLGLREILVVPGQTVRRIWEGYDTPGTYKVGCTIHPWIVMEITVEE